MKLNFLKKILLPNSPGVYFFRKGKDIFYIGKATSLRSRVRSYFSKDIGITRGSRIVEMTLLSNNLEWQKTDSVLEALILEAELIKKYQPKYNVRDKDDKSFSYVVITREEIPKVLIVRGKELTPEEKQSGNTFGPFTNGRELRIALEIIRKIFPFVDEKTKNYPEFYRQINLIPDLRNRDIYLENIKNIKLFFQGKKKIIMRRLEKEMKEYAARHEFEKAAEVKRQLFALKYINDIALINDDFLLRQSASSQRGSAMFRIEAYDIAHMSGKNMVGVMTVVENGEAQKGEYKKFRIRTQKDTNDTGALREVLERRFNHPEWQYPSLIVVDGGKAQLNLAKAVMLERELDIPVASVLKDERHKPEAILGYQEVVDKYKRAIMLANSEAHRFAINYHKNLRGRNFLKL